MSDSNRWAVEHADALIAAVGRPGIFRWTASPMHRSGTRTDVHRCSIPTTRIRIAFAQMNIATNAVVGTTSVPDRPGRPQSRNRVHVAVASRSGNRDRSRIEAAPAARAFDQLGAVRVEWHTDEFNEQSRAAIAKLGAQFEGLLRKHAAPGRKLAYNALFAMTDDDWPTIAPRGSSRHVRETTNHLHSSAKSMPRFSGRRIRVGTVPRAIRTGNRLRTGSPSPYGRRSTNTLAVLALVFAFLIAPMGIVFGHIARDRIRTDRGRRRGLALAGLIIGDIFTALGILAVIVWTAFFGLVATAVGIAANEASSRSLTYTTPYSYCADYDSRTYGTRDYNAENNHAPTRNNHDRSICRLSPAGTVKVSSRTTPAATRPILPSPLRSRPDHEPSSAKPESAATTTRVND